MKYPLWIDWTYPNVRMFSEWRLNDTLSGTLTSSIMLYSVPYDHARLRKILAGLFSQKCPFTTPCAAILHLENTFDGTPVRPLFSAIAPFIH